MDQATNLRNVVKLAYQREVSNARIITVTSGKGGVGKSNMAVNLATWFRNFGKRVIIFDADFGLANVEVMFGTVPKYNLSDVIYGSMDISQIITKGPHDIGFISGGSGIVGLNNLSETQLRSLTRSLNKLNTLCDVLIIDTGAGVSNQVLDFVLASPEVLVVSTPEPSSLTDAYSLLKALYKSPRFLPMDTKLYLVANKVASEEEGAAVYNKLNSVVDQFLGGSIDYLGMIPSDPGLEKAVRSQKVISITAPFSKSSKAFEQITKKLMDDNKKKNTTRGITHFFSNFLRKI